MTVKANSMLTALLESGMRSKPTEAEILTKGNHMVNSAINLIDEVRELYGDETADLLELRLLRAIKTRSPDKFRLTKK